jgi:hypothetical protein
MLAKHSPSHHGKRIDRIILTATEHLQGCKLCRGKEIRKTQGNKTSSNSSNNYLFRSCWLEQFLKCILIANYGF